MEEIKPCECGTNRWQTVIKNLAWKCRNCGKVRSTDSKLTLLFNMQKQPIEAPPPPASTPWTENSKVSDDVAVKIS